MFCPNCGSLNDDNSKFCQSCGSKISNDNNVESKNVVNNVNPVNNVNYADIPTFSPAHSIFLIIFSFLCCGGIIGAIFAILSLVEGSKVKDFVAAGDIERAKNAKKESNKWIKATYITWAVIAALLVIYFVFMMIVGFASAY